MSVAGAMQGAAKVQGISVHTLLPLDDLTVGGGQDAKKVVGEFAFFFIFKLKTEMIIFLD